jgi:hypothetical protein
MILFCNIIVISIIFYRHQTMSVNYSYKYTGYSDPTTYYDDVHATKCKQVIPNLFVLLILICYYLLIVIIIKYNFLIFCNTY